MGARECLEHIWFYIVYVSHTGLHMRIPGLGGQIWVVPGPDGVHP